MQRFSGKRVDYFQINRFYSNESRHRIHNILELTQHYRRYLGQIQESRSGKCLDAVGRETPLAMRDCHGLGGYQTLMYSSAMEIRTATRCLSPDMSKVKVSKMRYSSYSALVHNFHSTCTCLNSRSTEIPPKESNNNRFFYVIKADNELEFQFLGTRNRTTPSLNYMK